MEASTGDPYPELLFILAELFPVAGLSYFFIIAILLALLFASAMISGSEVAFFSLSSDEISYCKKSNKPTHQRIISLLEKPKNLLATILILNNMVNVAIVMLSTYLTWAIFGRSTEGLLVASLTFVTTFAIVFFGEVVPKVYASKTSLDFARMTVNVISFANTLFRPFAWLLMSLSDRIERNLERKNHGVSVDELNHALELTTQENTSEEEKGILKGIVNFGTLSVRQVMRSRLDITAVDYEADFHELMDRINKSGYSRIPIYKETIDSIEGIMYVKELLPYIDRDETFQWQTLLHPGFFVPESKKIDSLLRDFQAKRVHMAIVVDEYGGTSGLITLEDIIEEIVGEINDEFDEDAIHYNKLDDNTYIFEGKTSLNDFCKVIQEDPSVFEEVKGESESLGGLLLEIHAKMPRAGEKVSFSKFVFTVVAVDSKRIKRIRVFIKKNDEANVSSYLNRG